MLALVMCLSMFPAVGNVSASTITWKDNAAQALSGAGTAEDPYQIKSGAELAKFVNDGTGYGKLMNDIDLAAYEWFTTTSKFSGTLDGNSYMISGLRMGTAGNRTQAANAGLISILEGGTVKNLALDVTLYITGSGETGVGGVAGTSSGTINNCTVSGVIDGSHSTNISVGGIVGSTTGGQVLNCTNRASLSGACSAKKNLRVSGIVGSCSKNSTTISNCVNYGSVYLGEGTHAGVCNAAAGICVVKETAVISNCLNLGTLTKDSTNKNGTLNSVAFPTTVTSETAYYMDGEKYVDHAGTVEFATEEAMLEKLNANVTAAGADSGWLTWVLGNDGFPVPGADLLPLRLTGTVTVSGTVRFGETLTAAIEGCNETNLTYQWRRSNGQEFVDIQGATGLAYTLVEEDIGHTIQFIASCEGYSNGLAYITAVVAKLDGPAAPSVTGVNATNATSNDGKISGTTANMEYSKDVTFATATDCTAGDTVGLAPGVYYVRMKATATVAAGASVQVIIRDATAPVLGWWTDEDNYTAGDLSGTGTESDPYIISSEKDLAKLAVQFNTVEATAGKYFKITASELDMSANEWVPIANFAGILDGNNVKITGLTIGIAVIPGNYNAAGFIGYLNAGGAVKNLNITASVHIDSKEDAYVGVIAGKTQGSIDHCVANGEISVQAMNGVQVGGIVGTVAVTSEYLPNDVYLINLGSNVTINALSLKGTSYAGGIVGRLQYRPEDVKTTAEESKLVAIINCYNTGSITAGSKDDGDDSTASRRSRAGGIAGYLRGNRNTDIMSVTLQNCYNTGTLALSAMDSGIQGSVDGIIGNGEGAWRDKGYIAYTYADSNCALASQYATVPGAFSGDPMTLAAMQSADFALQMSINANSVVASGFTGLNAWTIVDGTPVLADTYVSGTAVVVESKINSSRLGTVKIEVSSNGTDFVVVGSRALVEKGDTVKITVTPTAGCAVKTATVNGTAISFTDNVYTVTVQEAVAIDIVFEVTSTTDVDPIYVAADANAAGAGTITEPCILADALVKIREIILQCPTANLTVYLRGGTYVLNNTIELGAMDSSLGRLTFINYNGEEVTFTSAHAVTGTWTKVEGKEYYSAQISMNADGTYPAFRDLLINGQRANLAKSKEYTYKYNWVNFAKLSGSIEYWDNLLYISPELLEGITNENLNGVELGQLMEWKSQIFHIGALTGETKEGEVQISLNPDEYNRLINTESNMQDLTGRIYWLQNHINFLDEPGEFYYDQSTGTVYYYPPSDVDMATANIGYATLDYLVEMENAANITFDGITFTGTTVNDISEHGLQTFLGNTFMEPIGQGKDAGYNVPYSAIHGISNVEGVEVLNCVFTELGGSAMIFDYGIKDLTVTGNVMKDLAMAGIQVGRNQRVWNDSGVIGSSTNVTITNNYITNIGLSVFGVPAIRVARSENLAIQHNTIIHVPYSAIMAGYGWNLRDNKEANTNLINADISYNYIEDFLYKINDGGGIYTCGANDFAENTELFNEIHHNYIRAGAHNKTYSGIYHDGSASNWYTHHNVIDDLVSNSGPMHFQDVVLKQNTHNVTAAYNYTSVSKISTKAVAERNISLYENRMLEDRAALMEIPEVVEIFNGAGLEAAYAGIASPMDISVQIQDDSMHYMIDDSQQSSVVVNVKLTNNTNLVKNLTLTVEDGLPEFISYDYTGNGVALQPGESTIVQVKIIANKNSLKSFEDMACGFVVTEGNGLATSYPRQFTLRGNKVAGNVIAHGTPVIDGQMDEKYLESTKVVFGQSYASPFNVFGINADSDADGYAYMLWDEQYLYVYAYVSERTVMSRGIDYINANRNDETQKDLWKNDSIEAYIASTYRNGQLTKFAVDAFGIQGFTNSDVSLDVINPLQFATKFTYNNRLLDLEIKEPTAGQTAGSAHQIVEGYVIEMTLPLTTCVDLMTAGQPQAGDLISFYIQVNDYTMDYTDAENATAANVVSSKNDTQWFELVGDGHVCRDINKNHICDGGCGAYLGKCEDTDRDHYCDYGCGNVFGECDDKDGDGLCDYGCGDTFAVDGDPAGDLPLFTRIINFIVDLFRKLLALLGLTG